MERPPYHPCYHLQPAKGRIKSLFPCTKPQESVLNGQWQEISKDIVPLNFSNLGQTLAGVIESVQEPELIGSERVHNYDAYRIWGLVKSNDLSTLVPNAGDGFDLDLELLVDRNRGLLLQVLIAGQMIDTDVPETIRILTLDDIDSTVEINAPR